jgi:hypothetical protein
MQKNNTIMIDGQPVEMNDPGFQQRLVQAKLDAESGTSNGSASSPHINRKLRREIDRITKAGPAKTTSNKTKSKRRKK